jgi:hypothetical protein
VYAIAMREGLLDDVKKLSQQQMRAFNRMRPVVTGGAEADRAAVAEASAAFDDLWEQLESGQARAAGALTDESAGAYMRRKFGEFLQKAQPSQTDVLERTFNSKLRMQANIDGGEPDLQHPLHPCTYQDLEGPRILPSPPAGGYSKLIETIAAKLPPDRVDVALSAPVTCIHWGRAAAAPGECVAPARAGPAEGGGGAGGGEGGGVCVEYCVGGRTEMVVAPAVIVTVSLAVLQGGAIEFSPPLPSWKREAVGRMRLGQVETARQCVS